MSLWMHETNAKAALFELANIANTLGHAKAITPEARAAVVAKMRWCIDMYDASIEEAERLVESDASLPAAAKEFE